MELSRPSDADARDADARRLARAGTWALLALCVAGAAAAFGVAWVMPDRILLVPTVFVGLAAGLALLSNETAATAAVIAGSALLFDSGGSDHPAEFIYDAYLVLYIAMWYGRRIGRVRIVETAMDRIAAAVIGLAGLAVVLGLVYGSDALLTVKESLSLVPLALYFPVRSLCTHHERGPAIVANSLIALGIAATAFTVYMTISRLMSATAVWEILRVRASGTEVQIMVALVLAGVAVGTSRRRSHTLLATAVLGTLLGGLILTKSRGYWLGAVVGLGVVWLASRPALRGRLTLWGTVGAALMAIVALIVAGDLVVTLFAGIVERLGSISAAGTDLSLLNRFRESTAVWREVRDAPVVGHGLGATYRYFSIESGTTRVWNYIHNGFAALFFKQGIVGFVATLLLWAGAVWRGLRVYRRFPAAPVAAGGLALGASAAMVSVFSTAYTSDPFYIVPYVTVTTVLIGAACGVLVGATRHVGTA